jgi:hypothetical protein
VPGNQSFTRCKRGAATSLVTAFTNIHIASLWDQYFVCLDPRR